MIYRSDSVSFLSFLRRVTSVTTVSPGLPKIVELEFAGHGMVQSFMSEPDLKQVRMPVLVCVSPDAAWCFGKMAGASWNELQRAGPEKLAIACGPEAVLLDGKYVVPVSALVIWTHLFENKEREISRRVAG